MSSEQPSDPNAPSGRAVKARDASALVLVIGILLLATPLVSVFTQGHMFAGLPVAFAFIFGVWLALIVAAAILARALGDRDAG